MTFVHELLLVQLTSISVKAVANVTVHIVLLRPFVVRLLDLVVGLATFVLALSLTLVTPFVLPSAFLSTFLRIVVPVVLVQGVGALLSGRLVAIF